MLRAEELIIGDWVQVTHNGKPRYVQVTFIGLPDDIGYDIYYRSGDGWGINVNDFKLHYVHELQYSLKDCKLFELAENFKVE